MGRWFVVVVGMVVLGSCASDGRGGAGRTTEVVESSSTTSEAAAPGPPMPAMDVVFRSVEIDLSSTSIPILFTERECSSGRPADDRAEITVVETEETIDVEVLITPAVGDVTCVGNPRSRGTIELESPVGDRRILGVEPAPASVDDVRVAMDAAGAEIEPMDFTEVEVALGSFAEARCEDLGLPYGAFGTVGAPRVDPELVFSELLDSIDGPRTGWFRSQRPGGSGTAIQWSDGVVVAYITVFEREFGWGGEAGSCGGFGSEWLPDSEVPEIEPTRGAREPGVPATPGDVAEARRLVESAIGNGALELPPVGDRCPTWIRVEDALADGGWTLRSRPRLPEPVMLGADQSVFRERELLVRRDDGRTISVRTSGAGPVVVEAQPGIATRSRGSSDFAPCDLDTPLRLEVVAAPFTSGG